MLQDIFPTSVLVQHSILSRYCSQIFNIMYKSDNLQMVQTAARWQHISGNSSSLAVAICADFCSYV